jgi:hypothetical protein
MADHWPRKNRRDVPGVGCFVGDGGARDQETVGAREEPPKQESSLVQITGAIRASCHARSKYDGMPFVDQVGAAGRRRRRGKLDGGDRVTSLCRSTQLIHPCRVVAYGGLERDRHPAALGGEPRCQQSVE